MINVIVLDPKLDYCDLSARYGDHWVQLHADSTLKLALQNPTVVSPHIWINQIATLFCARAGLIASAVTMAGIMRRLLPVLNPKPTRQLLFPDFRMLAEVAESLPKTIFATKSAYTESLVQMLNGAAQAAGPLFENFNGLDVQRDIFGEGRHLVITMPGLEPPWLAHFIRDLLIWQVLVSRVRTAHRVDALEVLFVLDEADEFVAREADAVYPQGYMSPVQKALRLGREFGVGVCIGVGALGPVSQHVLNNASNHLLLFKMTDTACCTAAARTLQLGRGADAIIPVLEPGQCLARTPAWPHAVLTRIDYVPPDRGGLPETQPNPHIPSRPLAEMPEVLAALEELMQEHKKAKQRRAKLETATMRGEAQKLLELAADHQYFPVARLWELMGTPAPAAQKRVREQLTVGEYACFVDLRIGRKTLALMELRDAGWELLHREPARLRGRGDLPHRTISHWICEVGRKRGYEVHIEWVVPGTTHATDAAWFVDGGYEVFEVIVTCERNIVDHVRASLLTELSPVKRVTIVAPVADTLKSVEKRLRRWAEFESVQDRVGFLPAGHIEKELFP